jgi:predicted Zn-dependent protease
MALAAAGFLSAVCRAPAHGDVHQAIITLTKELEAKPGSETLLFERAALYAQYEHWTEALADLDNLKTLHPACDREPALRADILRRSGKPAEAKGLQEAFLKKHPQHARVRWDYCQTLADLKETEAALRELDALMATAQHPAPDVIALRLRVAEAADAAAALTWLDEFLTRHPLPVFQEEALRLELKLGRRAAALQRMDRMIAAAPRPEYLLLRKAELLVTDGDRAGATAVVQEARKAMARLPAHIRSSRAFAELEAKAAAIPTTSP